MEIAMTDSSARNYYERRERQERELAQAAPSPNIKAIHATLARTYATLAVEGEAAPCELRIAQD